MQKSVLIALIGAAKAGHDTVQSFDWSYDSTCMVEQKDYVRVSLMGELDLTPAKCETICTD